MWTDSCEQRLYETIGGIEVIDYEAFRELSPASLSVFLDHSQLMNYKIRPIWPTPRSIAGPAYTVRVPRGDNMMFHYAMDKIPEGVVVVVESGDTEYALCGSNGFQIVKRHGGEALVLDGMVREPGDAPLVGLPVFARGVVPQAAFKEAPGDLNVPIRCGGVRVFPGDVVVASDDGVAVVPKDQAEAVLLQAIAQQAGERDLRGHDPDERERIHTVKHADLFAKYGRSN